VFEKPFVVVPLPACGLGAIGQNPAFTKIRPDRGASPIQSAILNDEKDTGTALFLIDEKVDHGAIIANRKSPIRAWHWRLAISD